MVLPCHSVYIGVFKYFATSARTDCLTVRDPRSLNSRGDEARVSGGPGGGGGEGGGEVPSSILSV